MGKAVQVLTQFRNVTRIRPRTVPRHEQEEAQVEYSTGVWPQNDVSGLIATRARGTLCSCRQDSAVSRDGANDKIGRVSCAPSFSSSPALRSVLSLHSNLPRHAPSKTRA